MLEDSSRYIITSWSKVYETLKLTDKTISEKLQEKIENQGDSCELGLAARVKLSF